MTGNEPGIYFSRRTKEISSVNGHEEEPNLKGWAKVSDDPTLRLLEVRKLLRERGLVRDATRVYWSGFRGSSSNGSAGFSSDLRFSGVVSPVGSAESPRRGGALASAWTTVRRLLRSILRLGELRHGS